MSKKEIINAFGDSFVDGTTEGSARQTENEKIMNAEEWKLWNMLDIKGYGATLFALDWSFSQLKRFLVSDKKEQAESEVMLIEDMCREFSERIRKINPDLYDNKFPLESIKELTENGPAILQDIINIVRLALTSGSVSDEQIREFKSGWQFFAKLSEQLSESGRFLDYTTSRTTEERW